MRTTQLLTWRRRAAARRFGAQGGLARAVELGLGIGAAGAVAVGMVTVARGDVAAADLSHVHNAIRQRAFWLSLLPALVACYATFDLLFRGADRAALSRLPVPGGARVAESLVRAALLHTPLVGPGLAYAWGLALAGAPTAVAVYAGALPVLSLALAVPVGTWLHLLAGRSLDRGASGLKALLSGGVVVTEEALLLYSPAGALAVVLGVGMFNDLFLYRGLVHAAGGSPALAWAPVVWTLTLAFLGVRRAMHLGQAALPLILARFVEAEAPVATAEEGVPARTPGEGLARWLPAAARSTFLRDLRQLRRRYRLDRMLLWVYAFALLRLGTSLADQATSPLGAALAHVAALTLVVGTLLVSAFRVRGELAAPWLSATLPQPRGPARVGRLAAAALYPAWALGLTAASAWWAAGAAAGAWALTLGAGAVLVLVVGADLVAARAPAGRALGAALAWRALVLGALGLVLWLGDHTP